MLSVPLSPSLVFFITRTLERTKGEKKKANPPKKNKGNKEKLSCVKALYKYSSISLSIGRSEGTMINTKLSFYAYFLCK